MGTLLASRTCHYCGRKATTEDHVVPRAAYVTMFSRLPYWFRQHAVVPACHPCNGAKADLRSDCNCETCTYCWNVARGCGWLRRDPPVVNLTLARERFLERQRENSLARYDFLSDTYADEGALPASEYRRVRREVARARRAVREG